MTQCNTVDPKEQGQMTLDLGHSKLIHANFDGGQIWSDGGLLLLRKADQQLELTELTQFCFGDPRRPGLLRHSVLNMLRQRIYGIAAGYEDCNDASKFQLLPCVYFCIKQ